MTKIYDYNHETNESVLRDATAEEIAELEIVASNMEVLKTAEIAAAATKAAVLEKLGLTAEELAAVLS